MFSTRPDGFLAASARSGFTLAGLLANRSPTLADLGLTGRQVDVLAHMVQGKPNKVICRDLGLAEGTV